MHHSLEIMSILPLMTDHLFWKAIILSGLYIERGGSTVSLIVYTNVTFRSFMDLSYD